MLHQASLFYLSKGRELRKKDCSTKTCFFSCLFSPAVATLKKALTAHRASGAGGQRGQSAQREHGVCSCVPGRPSNLARQ